MAITVIDQEFFDKILDQYGYNNWYLSFSDFIGFVKKYSPEHRADVIFITRPVLVNNDSEAGYFQFIIIFSTDNGVVVDHVYSILINQDDFVFKKLHEQDYYRYMELTDESL